MEVQQKENKVVKKNSKKLKYFKTFLMMSGILIPTVCVIAVPLALNKKNNYRSTIFFIDSNESIKNPQVEKLENGKVRVIFEQKTENLSKIFNDNPRIINEKLSANHVLVYQNSILFFNNSGYNFSNHFAKSNNKINQAEIRETNQKIFSISLLNALNEFNKSQTNKNQVSPEFFIKSIDRVITSMTYAYQENDVVYYFDNSPGYRGYSTVNFFRSISNWLEEYRREKKLQNPVKYEIKLANIDASIEFNSTFKKIDSVYFSNQIIIEFQENQENSQNI